MYLVPTEVLPLPDSTDQIVLEDPDILRLTAEGGQVWVAELPTNDHEDGYTAIDYHENSGKLYAWSWSCWHVEIDTATGKIVERVFTK
jgi:hypothetical protein